MKIKLPVIAILTLVLMFMVGGYLKFNHKRGILAMLVAHESRVSWLPDSNPTARIMEDATRQKIAKDYTNAWKQQSICFITNDSTNLYAYFVPNLRASIQKNVDDLQKKDMLLIQKDMQHQLHLRFYSLDGQVVSLSDSTRVYQQVGDFKQVQYRYYDVLMLLEEGHWRIKHLILN